MTKPLLRFLLLLSGVYHDIAVRCCCSAFHAPSAQSSSKSKLPSLQLPSLQLPPTYTSCCKTDDARRRILSSTTTTPTTSSSTTVLFGYANVNDYFNSFQQNDEFSGSSGESGSNDGGRSSWSPNNTPREFKYIGHGRIRSSSSDSDNNNGDDEAAEGGGFDINNYFSSFGQQQRNDEEVDSENDGSYEHQTDTSYYHEQPPPRQKLSMEQIIANNNARLCPKSFLTQAAIQSFIYLLEECRDPHSGSWIQDFLGVQNLGNYHGTAAFDVSKYPSWESVLVDIMTQPNQKIIIRAKRRGRGHGGWSKNNPYLQERYVEFPIDIQPASLVQRLLTVREQLATEFERDLEIVGIVDGMIIESYFDIMKREREEQQQQQRHQQQQRDEDGWSSSGGDDGVVAPVTRAFDRISVDILSNFTEFTSSSSGATSSVFRKGNFDLLYNLCTQASVHHLLRELRESKVDKISYHWLQKFYSERAAEYFDGDQAFGRGDDFIDALLRSPPSLVSMDDGSTMGLTDPLRLAERVIAKRTEIAFAWIDEMREVKNDHLVLNDKLFRVMMGKAVNVQDEEAVSIEEERTWELADDTGMFE